MKPYTQGCATITIKVTYIQDCRIFRTGLQCNCTKVPLVRLENDANPVDHPQNMFKCIAPKKILDIKTVHITDSNTHENENHVEGVCLDGDARRSVIGYNQARAFAWIYGANFKNRKRVFHLI